MSNPNCMTDPIVILHGISDSQMPKHLRLQPKIFTDTTTLVSLSVVMYANFLLGKQHNSSVSLAEIAITSACAYV